MLGFYPRHIQYYEQALHHKSSSIKKEGCRLNNERLEFLGDAVLGAVVGDIVFRHFAGKHEGFLTNTRSKIVQRETLNKLAVEIGLDKLIISSAHTSTHNNYMYGNAFEALVGAIYLDKGYHYCMRFIGQRIMTRLINIDKVAYKEVNFKSKLIEWGQKKRVEIAFDLVEESKEGGSSPVFVTQVTIEGVACCTGKGYSKKESQQLAARSTLALLKKSSATVENILTNKKQREALSEQPAAAKEEEERVEIKAAESQPAHFMDHPDFDLSDIRITTQARKKEEIVSAAEAAAFQK